MPKVNYKSTEIKSKIREKLKFDIRDVQQSNPRLSGKTPMSLYVKLQDEKRIVNRKSK